MRRFLTEFDRLRCELAMKTYITLPSRGYWWILKSQIPLNQTLVASNISYTNPIPSSKDIGLFSRLKVTRTA